MKALLPILKGIKGAMLLVVLLALGTFVSGQQTQYTALSINNARTPKPVAYVTGNSVKNELQHARHRRDAAGATACDTDFMDYAAYDEAYADLNGLTYQNSWYTSSTGVALYPFSNFKTAASVDSQYYNYAGIAFDTIIFTNLADTSVVTYPLATSTITFDSLTIIEALYGDTTKMANDSLKFLIYSSTNGTFSNTPVVTLLYHGWAQLKQFYATGYNVNVRTLPVNYSFAQGQGFAVIMEYVNKYKTSTFNLAVSYAESCDTVVLGGNVYSSPAYPPVLPGNEFFGADSINAVQNLDNTAGYFGDGFPATCEYVYTQNWALIPLVKVCFPVTPVTVTITPSQINCHGQSTGSAAAVASGGNGTYSYAWSNNATGSNITGIAAGNYTVTVTSGTSSATAAVTITQPSTALTTAPTSTQTSCTASTGTALANATGGTPAYTYVWSNSATTATLSNLAAATYSVTVTDANGCSATGTTTVSTPPAFTASVSVTNVSCFGQNTGSATANTVGATGNLTYAWNSGSTQTISNLAAGTYSVTVTNAFNCSASASATITQPATAVTASASSTQTNCGSNTGTASVVASGGTGNLSYVWNTTATTTTINSLGVGNYTVTVSDANSCTATATTSVNTSATFVINISSTNVNCFGQNTGTASVSATGTTGNVTYVWSNGATAQNLTALPAATYDVTVTDGTGCPKTTSTIVTQPASALTAVIATTPTACTSSTGTATASVTGGTPNYTFEWSNSSTVNPATALSFGTVSLTVTDSKSCSVTGSASVAYPPADNVSLTPTAATCNGEGNGSIVASVTGNGNYTYLWSNNASTATITGVSGGNYSLTVTDGLGCSASASASVTQPAAIQLSTTTTDATNGANGTATVTATGGTSPYAYIWTGGATAPTDSALAAGTYTVTVTDANSCSATASATIVSTGINAVINNIAGITLIPNPANDVVKVVVSLSSAQNVDFRMIDITGNIVYTAHESTTQGNLTHAISLSQFAAGIYLVEVTAGNDVSRQRLVVAK